MDRRKGCSHCCPEMSCFVEASGCTAQWGRRVWGNDTMGSKAAVCTLSSFLSVKISGGTLRENKLRKVTLWRAKTTIVDTACVWARDCVCVCVRVSQCVGV